MDFFGSFKEELSQADFFVSSPSKKTKNKIENKEEVSDDSVIFAHSSNQGCTENNNIWTESEEEETTHEEFLESDEDIEKITKRSSLMIEDEDDKSKSISSEDKLEISNLNYGKKKFGNKSNL